jgi:site-specific DNA-methyltransferase (adenine-specific)
MSMAGNRTVGGEDVPHAHAVPDHVPITPEAQRARGLGTALKPSQEPIVVARKPLEGTVAANVLKWGTGALNIDGCRVRFASEGDKASAFPGGKTTSHGSGSLAGPGAAQEVERSAFEATQSSLGRWPPNTVFQHTLFCRKTGTRTVKATSGIRPDDIGKDYGMHKSRSMAGAKRLIITVAHASPDGTETVEAWECMEGCPVAELDRQSGVSKSRANARHNKGENNGVAMGKGSETWTSYGHNDAGGASRMFPCFDWQAEQEEDPLPPFAFHYFPKPPASEREAGCEGLPSRQMDESREEDAPGANNPRNRGGRERKNYHPTVKSIALMRWLTRLGCPAGGLVLDPFLGSGTTGCAAMMEGFDFIGIEREAEYAAIAEARIRHWQAVAEREDTKTRETP